VKTIIIFWLTHQLPKRKRFGEKSHLPKNTNAGAKYTLSSLSLPPGQNTELSMKENSEPFPDTRISRTLQYVTGFLAMRCAVGITMSGSESRSVWENASGTLSQIGEPSPAATVALHINESNTQTGIKRIGRTRKWGKSGDRKNLAQRVSSRVHSPL
jgi:hypothetical protein